MARIPFVCSPVDPYHLTARSHNKTKFPIPTEEVWEIMSLYLSYMHYAFDAKIHSFVLMSNHFHLAASFPEANLSIAMQYFMRETSRQIGSAAGQINQVYGNRTHRSRITNYHHFMNVYKYVYRNPVEAGLSERVEDYEFSTLRGLLGGNHLDFPVQEDTILFDTPIAETLGWLNRNPSAKHREAIRKGLKHKVFYLAPENRIPNELDSVLY